MNYKNIVFLDLEIKSDPNIASPKIEKIGNDVILTFENFTEDFSGEESKIQFFDCTLYRVGLPNDEAFYSNAESITNDTIYNQLNFPEIKFNTLYEVKGLEWHEIIKAKETIIIQKEYLCKKDYKHYIFFMKDGTFECIAQNYKSLTYVLY